MLKFVVAATLSCLRDTVDARSTGGTRGSLYAGTGTAHAPHKFLLPRYVVPNMKDSEDPSQIRVSFRPVFPPVQNRT